MNDEEAEFMAWLDRAYRDGSKGESAKFSKWNMEVAYRAGMEEGYRRAMLTAALNEEPTK